MSRRRPSLQVYLLSLLVLFVLAAAFAVTSQRQRNLDRAENSGTELVELQSSIAARRIGEALTLTQKAVADLAANPSLTALFAEPTPPGCSLSFTGAGPFDSGHIDVIDREGNVLCSSQPLPPPGRYANATWLTDALAVPGVAGPVRDSADDGDALAVSAPIPDQGAVVTFLVIDSAPTQLEANLAGTHPVRFTLGDALERPSTEVIAGAAAIEPIGWTVSAQIDRGDALADAHRDNRELALWMLVATLVLLAATYLLHLGLARPIRRLSTAVRTGAQAPERLVIHGPAEVVGLADDIATLQRNVTSELAGRERAEQDLARSMESYRVLFAANPLPMWVYDTESLRFLDVNDAAIATYGYSRHEFLDMTIRDIRPPEDEPALLESVRDAPPMERSGPWRHTRKDGTKIDVEITSHSVSFAEHHGRFVMAEDVTARERTRHRLERAERMESLGQLAGGIAHDFNNILAVILSYADFTAEALTTAAETEPDRWSPVLRDVEQIGVAGRRAAELTSQLLAFARGESADTGPLDLNDVVREAEELLHRTIGEQVDLRVELDPALSTVEGNAGQFAQVVINLAVNARDAMPGGGRLFIETSNVHVDHEQLQGGPDLGPGRYVRLRVSDTGLGMDTTAREHAFEPFFTTKGRGSGTGLGLATVYGIVNRSGGVVQLYSEPGRGTTVDVLLPITEATTPAPSPTVVGHASGTETILLVEDDTELREATGRILRNAGYRLHSAHDGPSAIEVARAHPGEIDLLLTDVVMPELLGSDLALLLHGEDPTLRVLFMSGYAPTLLLAGGTLPFGAPLIDKPFSAARLTARVREVLESPPPSTPGRRLMR